MNKKLVIKGARVNNLKNINVEIPRNAFVVFSGLSGSGKSSLAFDTIYAEGQRRYIESLSSYARMFLGQLDKPDVDSITGLSPAISIDQKSRSHNPRSTVGTVTEIYDYFRLLFAKIGKQYCPKCGKEINCHTIDTIASSIMNNATNKRLIVLAPVVVDKKGEFDKYLKQLLKDGYLRVEIDNTTYEIDSDVIKLEKNIRHNINIVIDRIIFEESKTSRLYDSLKSALSISDGMVYVDVDGKRTRYSTKNSCSDCDISFQEINHRLFSFNAPQGACGVCHGLGFSQYVDINKVVKNWALSINQGVLAYEGARVKDSTGLTMTFYKELSKRYNFSLDTPLRDLDKKIQDILFYGDDEPVEIEYQSTTFTGSFTKQYEGVASRILRVYNETKSEYKKKEFAKYMTDKACKSCNGVRLNKQALSVLINSQDISYYCSMPILGLQKEMENLDISQREILIAQQILNEIKQRISFLVNVGLGYLSLDRTASTLSGGEAQRIRLATQIGSGLTGVLYVLDEPSIGLHQRDNDRLLSALMALKNLGNTLIVVEHDEETIMRADHIVDIGPYAGYRGGSIIAQGTPSDIMDASDSITGRFLSGKEKIEYDSNRREGNGKFLKIYNARRNNLKNIDVEIPLNKFVVVTGVSGSGKSSLVNGVINEAVHSYLNGNKRYADCDNIVGGENIDKLIYIDQSPIGRTPRSNPATYSGVFTHIRDLFASLQMSKARGYKPGQFSFNVPGGRCEHCAGDGIIQIDMHFLSDIYVKCDVCSGKRYTRDTLEVEYKGKNISDVLDMSVDDAYLYFDKIPSIERILKTLKDVGLGYIKLGQSATTLSGGEAQRLKLASELRKRMGSNTLYVLDEPTTGLHPYDVKKLITTLNRFIKKGSTILVIEHNLDVIKVADHVIDLGPEGGVGGGEIVAYGTPEEVSNIKGSFTGEYLKKIL